MEREGKGYVVDRIDQLAVLLALDDHVADIPPVGDVALVHRRVLSGLPRDDQIPGLDPLVLAQPLDGPGQISDRDDIFQRLDAFRESPAIQEGLQ